MSQLDRPLLSREAVGPPSYLHSMRRAYIEASIPGRQAFLTAVEWAGRPDSIHVPATHCVDDNPWLAKLRIPITSSSAKSRFRGRPQGMVFGVFLNLPQTLGLEKSAHVEGIVAVSAYGPNPYSEGATGFAPWITAFDVEHLGGNQIAPTPDASEPVKRAVEGLTFLAVENQGLLDNRERSAAVQALTYLRDQGIRLEPDALMVEALRNGWGGKGPEELRAIALDLNAGKRLRFQERFSEDAMEAWVRSSGA